MEKLQETGGKLTQEEDGEVVILGGKPEDIILRGSSSSDQPPGYKKPQTVSHFPSREITIINRTEDIRKRARELTEKQLRGERQKGSLLNPFSWSRKIRLRIFEEYYRQLFTERALKAMVKYNNAYLTMDVVRNGAINANHHIAEEREAARAKISQVKLSLELKGERVEESGRGLRYLATRELIHPMIAGKITSEAQLQESLRRFIQNHQDEAKLKAIFGNKSTNYGILAQYFATDLLKVGENIKGDLAAHRYAISDLSNVISIKLANTTWAAQTEANFGYTDKFIASAERHKLTGVILNPVSIGAIASLGTYTFIRATGIGLKALYYAVPLAGIVPSALFATLRRNHDLKIDRSSHQVERAYNEQVPKNASRRLDLEEYAYNTTNVKQLIDGGGEEAILGKPPPRKSFQTLLERMGADPTNTYNQKAVYRRMAEILARLNYSNLHKVDLITYRGRELVEQDRLFLLTNVLKSQIAIKEILSKTGMGAHKAQSEIEAGVKYYQKEWMDYFHNNQRHKDRRFLGYRLRNDLGAAIFGGLVGLGIGSLIQEGLALGARALGRKAGQTLIEQGLNFIANKAGYPEFAARPIEASDLQALYQKEGILDRGNIKMQVYTDHHVAFIDKSANKNIIDPDMVRLEADGRIYVTGKIPDQLAFELRKADFQVIPSFDANQNLSLPNSTEIIPPEPLKTPPIVPVPFVPLYPPESLAASKPERITRGVVLPQTSGRDKSPSFDLQDLRKKSPVRLSDIIQFETKDEPRQKELLYRLHSYRAAKEPINEGEEALRLIRETFLKSPHVYVAFPTSLEDAAITSAYLEGIRLYTQKLNKTKQITVVVPKPVAPILKPLVKNLGYELIVADRYDSTLQGRSLMMQRGEEGAILFEFNHFNGMPLVDIQPSENLVVRDLFASSVTLYGNNRSGRERFSDFFSDLLSIPKSERVLVRPRIDISENEEKIFKKLSKKYRIDPAKRQISVIVDASHQTKRYSLENWQAVLQLIQRSKPNTEFNIILDPNKARRSYKEKQLRSILQGVTPLRTIARDIEESIVFLKHQDLVLSNDTGLAHIAAVLDNGPKVITLHIPLFPPDSWITDPDRHIGLLPQKEAIEGEQLINQIPPEEVAEKAISNW